MFTKAPSTMKKAREKPLAGVMLQPRDMARGTAPNLRGQLRTSDSKLVEKL
jgi:hypothetical protein